MSVLRKFGILIFLVILIVPLSIQWSVLQLHAEPASTFTDLQNSEAPSRAPINENPLSAEGRLVPHLLLPGANGEIVLEMTLAPKHHAYLDRFKIKVISPEGVNISRPKITPVIKFKDKFSKTVRSGIEGKASLRAVLELPEDYQGVFKDKMEVLLTYQACTSDYCLLPVHLPVSLDFSSAKEETSTSSSTLKAANNIEGPFSEALSKGWLYLFIFVFFAGVLTSFTPCIYPMIPITLAVLGTKDENSSRKKGFFLSLMYVFGIALTYSLLGLIAASTGGLFGSLLGHPVAVSIIAAVFVLMGLSMFGLFEIRLPHAITQKLTQTPNRKGFMGAFLTGIVAGVVASPCVGPVLTQILTLVATTQNLIFGFFLLFTFALGLGQIFLLLGTFSSFANRLPRSGPWMNAIKFIFGSIMIGMAIYYLEVVVPAWATKSLIALSLMLIALFHGAFRSLKDAKLIDLIQRALMWTLFVVGAYNANLGFKAWQEVNKNSSHPAGHHREKKPGPPWRVYSQDILNQAKAKGRPVILDIYADWCVACKELDHQTFSDPKILKATEKFYWVQYDATDSSTAEFKKLRSKYKIQGLPTVLFFDKKGTWHSSLTLTGFEKVPQFNERLEKLLGPSLK